MTATLQSAVRAALDGLEQAAETSVPPDAVLTFLGRIGDALRLGIEIQPRLRAWLRACPPDVAIGALGGVRRDAPWHLPELPVGGDDPLLAHAVLQRDEAESVLRAFLAWSAHQGVAPADVSEVASLDGALREFDGALPSVAGRETVERSLEARIALQSGAAAWVARLRFAEEASVPDAEDRPFPLADLHEPPGDEVVCAYVTEGAMARYVEGHAASNPEFADRLAESVRALVLASEARLVAQRWLAQRESPERSRPLVRRAALPPLAFAAASGPLPVGETVSDDLGALFPVRADARIVAKDGTVSIIVYPDDGADLREVSLGEGVCRAADAQGRWTVTVSRPAEPIVLRVSAADATFDVEIDLQDREP